MKVITQPLIVERIKENIDEVHADGSQIQVIYLTKDEYDQLLQFCGFGSVRFTELQLDIKVFSQHCEANGIRIEQEPTESEVVTLYEPCGIHPGVEWDAVSGAIRFTASDGSDNDWSYPRGHG